MSPMLARSVAAEFLGTALLVFLAVGSLSPASTHRRVGVALAFGLVLLALAYAIGPISGCHVNPGGDPRRAALARHDDHRGGLLLGRAVRRRHRGGASSSC